MPVTLDDFQEIPGSPIISSNGTRIEKRYWLTGTTDFYTALVRVVLNTDTDIVGVPRSDINIEPDDSVEGLWSVRVVYAYGTPGSFDIEPSAVGEESTRYSTRGGSVLMTQALEHLGTYPPTTEEIPIPNHGGAINVTKDGIKGIEVEVPGWTMIITRIYAADQITPAFIRGMYSASQTTNAVPWRGYEPGELRLVAVDLDPATIDTYKAVYEFTGQANLEDYTIGHILEIDKPGNAYVWSEHEKIEADGTTRQKLLCVHVERVYPETDFEALTGLEG